MDVGVRELKQHLSQYLDRAERGEVIRVTERGRPKAILAPLPGLRLEQGIAEGWIARPKHRGPLPSIKRVGATGSVLDALAEDRGDD